jgi:molybdopterin/thiamine biosynthesis adenylyltransferase
VVHLQRGRELFTAVYPYAFPRGHVITHGGHQRPPTYRDHVGLSDEGDDPAGLVALTRARYGRRTEQNFTVKLFSVLLPPDWFTLEGTGGRIEFGWTESLSAVLPRRVTGVKDGHFVALYTLGLQAAFPVKSVGWWVRGDALDWRAGPDAVAAKIEEAVAEHHAMPVAELRFALGHALAGYASPSELRRDLLRWTFLARKRNGEPVFGHLLPYRNEDFDVRAPFAPLLKGKRVAVVGCGSLGWPIAVGLARAGVRDFVLYDLDGVRAGNLARIGARIPHIGQLKVNALASELRQIASLVAVQPRGLYAGTHVGAESLIDARPDLIVDASAEEQSPPETNRAALALGAPVIYSWMTYTVRAARVFRVLPGRTACYACVANSRPRSVVGRDRRLSPNGIWDGANFNIDAVAAATVRMAVRTLAGDAVDGTNPDHVVLSFGGAVPTARRLEIPRDPKCAWCGRP